MYMQLYCKKYFTSTSSVVQRVLLNTSILSLSSERQKREEFWTLLWKREDDGVVVLLAH